MIPLSPSWKPMWIGLTDLRKLSRERRTIVLTIVLPAIFVIIVGTTFSLGYMEFESKELAIGIIKHQNSTYAEMIESALWEHSAQAILYDTVEDAREDLIAEKIDAIIEIDPWIIEKMGEFKKSWIAIYADETRPLLTAAIEVVMLQAKQAAVDEVVWEYVGAMRDEVVPDLLEVLDRIQNMMEKGEVDAIVEDALVVLGTLESVDEEAIRAMAIVVETGLEEIVENGSAEEKIIVAMINRSAVVGTLRGLSDSKPLLDSSYHFLRYIHPHLGEIDKIPLEAARDLSSLTGNLSQIKPEQALLIKAVLPLLRGSLIEMLAQENPNSTCEEIERTAENILKGTSELMDVVRDRGDEIANLSNQISHAKEKLESANLTGLLTEANDLLESVSEMEKGYLTSPIYLMERPTYFGSETRRYVDYISSGIFAFGILFSVLVYTVLSVVRDREKGILRRIFICNVNRWNYIGGKCIICLGIAAIQILILTACAILIFDIYIVNVPKTFVYGLYSSIGFVGLGLLISSISKTELEALTASFGLCFIMLIISGIFYPFELSPSIVRHASRYMPITYVANLLKAGMIRDATLSEVSGDLISVGIYGSVTLLAGALAFRWRKKG